MLSSGRAKQNKPPPTLGHTTEALQNGFVAADSSANAKGASLLQDPWWA